MKRIISDEKQIVEFTDTNSHDGNIETFYKVIHNVKYYVKNFFGTDKIKSEKKVGCICFTTKNRAVDFVKHTNNIMSSFFDIVKNYYDSSELQINKYLSFDVPTEYTVYMRTVRYYGKKDFNYVFNEYSKYAIKNDDNDTLCAYYFLKDVEEFFKNQKTKLKPEKVVCVLSDNNIEMCPSIETTDNLKQSRNEMIKLEIERCEKNIEFLKTLIK